MKALRWALTSNHNPTITDLPYAGHRRSPSVPLPLSRQDIVMYRANDPSRIDGTQTIKLWNLESPQHKSSA